MQITIDTNAALSDTDRQILTLLLGGKADWPQVEDKEEPKAEPKPKAKAKPKAKEPEPEPEPIAEEPVEEDEPEDEPEEDDAEDVSDEDLLDLAVKKATEMVGSGEAAKVREALDAAGASRVRELNADNVREFFKALS